MNLSETLDTWLAAKRAWLLENGPSLLALDPSHEKLVADDDRYHGVAIKCDENGLIPIFGLTPRAEAAKGRSQLKAMKAELSAIVMDEPFDTINTAIDSLARYRATREGAGDWQSGYMRIPAMLPHYVNRTAHGAKLSSEEIFSSCSGILFGAMSWSAGSHTDQARHKLNRKLQGVFFACPERTMTAHCLWLGCKHDAMLGLTQLRGPRGWDYGRLVFNGKLPETIANIAVGKSLKSLVSFCLTDPFDLHIVSVRQSGKRVSILFTGAEHLRKHITLFDNESLNGPFLNEVAKLNHAKETLIGTLSMACLPDRWWKQFQSAALKRGAPKILSDSPLQKSTAWVPLMSYA